MSMNQVVASPHEFKHGDKTYRVLLFTQEVKAAFEKRLFNKRKEALVMSKSDITKGEYLEALTELNEQYLNGEFGVESVRGRRFMTTPGGMANTVALLWGCTEQEAWELMMKRRDDVLSLFDLVVKESFPFEEAEEEEAAKPANFQETSADS